MALYDSVTVTTYIDINYLEPGDPGRLLRSVFLLTDLKYFCLIIFLARSTNINQYCSYDVFIRHCQISLSMAKYRTVQKHVGLKVTLYFSPYFFPSSKA